LLLEWVFKLSIPLQLATLFAAFFLLILATLTIGRVIGIRMWGSVRQYFKYDPNSMTFKQILFRSFIMSAILVTSLFVFILFKRK
jgi:hypothetical protein